MTTVYSWKPAAHLHINAEAAGAELVRIYESKNGALDNEAIVEAARDEQNPLHEHFEWDDEAAAHAYRLDQAGYLLRMITFKDSADPEDKTPIRAFVSVQQDDERFYVKTVDAMASPELRRQVVSQAWRELEAWRDRHAELVEFAKIFSEIDQARVAK